MPQESFTADSLEEISNLFGADDDYGSAPDSQAEFDFEQNPENLRDDRAAMPQESFTADSLEEISNLFGADDNYGSVTDSEAEFNFGELLDPDQVPDQSNQYSDLAVDQDAPLNMQLPTFEDSAEEALADFFVEDDQLDSPSSLFTPDLAGDPHQEDDQDVPSDIFDADSAIADLENLAVFDLEDSSPAEEFFTGNDDLVQADSFAVSSSELGDIFAELENQPASDPLSELLETENGGFGDDLDLDLNGGWESAPSSATWQENPSAPIPVRSEIDDLAEFFGVDDEQGGISFDIEADMPLADPLALLTTTADIPDLEDLEALVAPSIALETTAVFADLEALIDDAPIAMPSSLVGGDTFQDLEAMLGEVAISGAATNSFDQDFVSDLETALRIAPLPTNGDHKDKTGNGLADLEKLLADKTSSPAPTASAPVEIKPAKVSQPVKVNNVRVDVKYLDSLNNLVGELVVNRNLLGQEQERIQTFLKTLLDRVQQLSDVSQKMRDQYDRSLLESSVAVGRSRNQTFTAMALGGTVGDIAQNFDDIEFDRYNAFHILSQEILELIVKIKESASDIEFVVTETEQVSRELGRIATQIQDDLKQSRMVPFANLADRLPRGVRDRAVKSGKQAELRVIGGDTLIDKSILEQLTDPMTHLVNNAVDHGLESPEERRQSGKPSQGTIEVKAYHQGNQTLITVRDDGGGINPEKVKDKAVKKGLKTPEEVARMNANEAYELLFLPGFSTRDMADQFAGRGVGLDVVKTCLDSIKGSIYIDSQIGQGTQFTIRLPLTLSISKAIFCVTDRVRVAIPIDGFEDMVEVPRSQVITNNVGQECILWQDTMLPFQPLSNLLSFNRKVSGLAPRSAVYAQENDEICVVVVRDSENNYLGLKVDQFLGEYEIVVKQLEGPVPKPPGIAGATVLGDGRVISIVNVLELFDIHMGRITAPDFEMAPPDDTGEVESQPIVLIVDDSIVVREMLSATFTKVGYFVEVARDGQDALEKLRGGLPCDLIFCDIEMPKMDGMQLLSTLQKDEQLSQIPMAMLTSRGADKHRQTAIQLGAKAYFTKPYLEEELLTASQKLLKGEVLV
jgi:chemosensory pili system protein ChpA (sensor histidine kinase/response regulator)